ncbi:MAG: hypothetical protein ACRDQ9_13500 [Pseudonocardiaceae bacterium]
MLRAGLVLLVVLVVLLTAVWLLQRRLIYFPDTAVPPAGSVLPGVQEITLRTEDGLVLGAWHVAPTGADRGITRTGHAGQRRLARCGPRWPVGWPPRVLRCCSSTTAGTAAIRAAPRRPA